MPKKTLTDEEARLLRSVESGDWISTESNAKALEKYRSYAAETLRKDRRVNIRISHRDLESLQKRALREGLPYQTLIASILHKYVSGRLSEKP